MSAPAVSVVLPAWNAAAWIDGALRSALGQRPPPAEVIVVDDGSTDGTAAAAERFGGVVRVLRLPHRGQAAATNAGVAEACGDYVALLHADDEWLPGKTEAQLRALEERPDAVLAYCDLWLVHADGSTRGRFLQDKPFAADGRVFDALLEQCFVLPSATLIRRRLFREDGLRFPEDLEVALDYELWLRAALRHPFARVDAPLVRRGVREDAASRRSVALHRDHVILMRRLREEIAGRREASASLRILDRRLAGMERSLALDRYRAGRVAEARRLLGASLRRRPSSLAASLWLLCLAGRPGRAAVAAARGWNGAD